MGLEPIFCTRTLRDELSLRARKEKLIELLEGPVQNLGYELVDVEVHTSNNGLLRVYIDRDAGINLDDCEVVSHQISAVLDVEDPMPGRYVLEVSSPGSDRPLRTIEHFERYRSQMVRIKLSQSLNGQRNFKGRLLDVEDNDVLVSVDDEVIRLSHADIASAQLLPEH
jgi:ribosome maturation factor RimP